MNEKMNEMQLPQPQRRSVLQDFRKQIEAWGLSMPRIEPLVWDFGLNQYDHIGLIEYWICNESEADYCGKFLFVFDNQTCPMHSHEDKHETFFVLKGKIQVSTDQGKKILEQGAVLPIPTQMKHSFTGLGNALVLEISKSCDVEDNQFSDPKIMQWLKSL